MAKYLILLNETFFFYLDRSLSESESLDLPGLCNAYVKKCQKSMKIAVECRYAHEYGDTSINELLAVGESMEQERESTSTPTDTETTEMYLLLLSLLLLIRVFHISVSWWSFTGD